MLALAMIAATTLATSPRAFVEHPCTSPEQISVARCGTVEVPENRRVVGGRKIRLNVVILPAVSDKKLPPLFDIEGGPGNASTGGVIFYAKDGIDYRRHRDVVLVDQRGTGQSNLLDCPELSAIEAALQPMLPNDAVDRCRTELAKRADLRFYGTSEAVADLDDVRVALGYKQIDLTGISYGTTFVLRYIAAHPEQVRSAVLVAPVPADARPPRDHATLAQRQRKRIAEQCTADPACHGAFDVERDFKLALARLPSIGGAPTGEVFVEMLRKAMYRPDLARRIPLILHHAAKGDLSPFRAIAKSTPRAGHGDGSYLSITCSESMALMDVAAARATSRATQFGDYRLRRQQAACQRWPAGRVAPRYLDPVRAAVPILMFAGTDDPVASIDWAKRLERELPKGRLLAVPGGGHGLDGLNGLPECYDAIALRFFEVPDVGKIDASCLARLAPPPFAIDSSANHP